MNLDADLCYKILQARDARFDGHFFVGVSTTGIYCRPICAVRIPGRDRCTFYPSAAGAEAAGYRPCLRCRPELAPGHAPIDSVKRVARAVVARIEQGALGTGGLEELAEEFGLSTRQLRRIVSAEYGVNPIAIAKTRRLLLAKQLLTDTQLRIVDIAFASGFSSVRQFNRTFVQDYRLSPGALRRRQPQQTGIGIPLKLGFRGAFAWSAMTGFLLGRASMRTERMAGDRYVRAVRLGAHQGWIAAQPASHNVLQVEVAPSLLPALPELQARLRRLFDLDANPAVIESHLERDPALRALIQRTPGLRVPGAFDGFELALRAILGQQVTVKAATTIFGRFVDTFGQPIETPVPELDRLAPTAADVASASLQQLIDHGLTRKRAETVSFAARAIADGIIRFDPSMDATEVHRRLREIPGIGPWTAEYIAMRALGDPDGFPSSDLGLMRALNMNKPAELEALAESWRPWRAYAAIHAWHSLGAGG
jgi:AraC family transcriptional regulator of adaptative response / DNA-3-methyladenine glycosylase II